MRLSQAILFTAFTLAGSLHAEEYIRQEMLDETLLAAKAAAQAQDYGTAFELYTRAAEWGHKGAQYVLGELYLRGKGVARDPVVGTAWLEVAAEAPDQEFRRALRQAERQLTEIEKQQAQALAERISAAYGMEAAGIKCRTESRTGSNMRVVNCAHRRSANGDLIVPDFAGEVLAASS